MEDRAHRARHLPLGCRVLVPDRRDHGRLRLRRSEVDGLRTVRGDAEGGDGRGGRATLGGHLPAGPDRRDVRRARDGRGRRAARHSRAEPRRRLPQRPRDGAVRLHRWCRIGAAGPRRRAAPHRRHGRGTPRHGPVTRRQGRCQPDGDAAGLRRGTRPRGRPRGSHRRRGGNRHPGCHAGCGGRRCTDLRPRR